MSFRARRIITKVWCFLFIFLIMIFCVNTPKDTLAAYENNVNVHKTVYENDTQPLKENGTKAGPDISSPSAILMEASTGRVIYEKNADEALHPASITKIMTLDLIFDALDEGKITLDEEVVVSEHAASMGGSQVFLEVGETQTVETMIKCIAVASANDASTAMAEHVAGSEEGFVARMNEKAKELGMNNTTFVNCCGLDVDGHMSSARDVALMSRDLINRHPQIHDYSTIWMDTITHVTRKGESEFGLSNTNKLIKQYQWATGLKTGSTGLAKCCLSATAEKDGIDLIAVIMAAESSKNRFSDATALLNYGYSVCQIYKDDNMQLPENVRINQGKKENIKCRFAKDFSYLFLDSYDKENIIKETNMYEITAPINEEDVVGTLDYYYGTEKIGSVDIVAAESVKKAEFSDALLRIMRKLTWITQM
ncbi:MAG: D-alanyl-D-alanine carboxypeptidase family protein [Eubacteriales bacterium]|nr:D-alanyl-D-alanine carboxypeptidase family protein [Eubacteriales bacterium]